MTLSLAEKTKHLPTTPTTLPLVDISGLRAGDPDSIAHVADQIGRAARDIGFFRIQGHGIDLDLIERAYIMARRFFARSDDFKKRYYIGLSTNHRGYVPFSEKGDYPDEVNRNYEAFDMGLDLPSDDPDYLAGNRLLGPNVWPDVPEFKATISAYYAEISALGRMICGALETHLDLTPGRITGQMSKPISQLRLLHYVRESAQVDAKSINMGAHTDYECLTLLHTRNEGLQVMTNENLWIDVPVDRRVFVVNIGDMLEAWSNGLLRSTPHRVLNLSPERFSMPYFVAADYHATIAPFPELQKTGNPSRYQPFTAGAHLERMLRRDFAYLRAQDAKSPKAPNTDDGPITNPFEDRMNSNE